MPESKFMKKLKEMQEQANAAHEAQMPPELPEDLYAFMSDVDGHIIAVPLLICQEIMTIPKKYRPSAFDIEAIPVYEIDAQRMHIKTAHFETPYEPLFLPYDRFLRVEHGDEVTLILDQGPVATAIKTKVVLLRHQLKRIKESISEHGIGSFGTSTIEDRDQKIAIINFCEGILKQVEV